MKSTMKKTVAILPATMLLAMGLPAPAFAVTNWTQGFESNKAGWFENGDMARMDRVASGEAGIVSASGTNHAVMTGPGMFTRFDGYAKEWDGTWTAEVDVFLDPAWDAGDGFDYSVAANDSSGNHRRDFVFHVTKDTSEGKLLVGASNNSNPATNAPREDLEVGNHGVVEKAGWYTLKHTFRDDGGTLAVDLQLVDANGVVVFTETRKAAADSIATTGGNRYGWFSVLKGIELPIDNTRIDHSAGEAGRFYSTNFTDEAITKAMKNRWHMSGSYDAAIVSEAGDAKLRISNATVSGSFGDQLFAPELSVAATESSTDNVFDASFTIEPTAYQEGLNVTVSPDDGNGGRNGFLRITHQPDRTMKIEALGSYVTDDGSVDWETKVVGSGLALDAAHTVTLKVVKWASATPADVNDVFRVSVDGGSSVEVGTFEAYYHAVSEPNHPTRTLLFRVSSPTGGVPALEGKGLVIDDLSMSVSTEKKPVTPPVVPPVVPPVTPPVTTPPVTTPPVTQPVTPPVTPPTTPAKPAKVAKAIATPKSGKSKLHVNVNPNKGSGYWKVKIQKKTSKGTWKTLSKTYKTKGSKETMTVNLPKGTYRAVVLAKYGYGKGYSNPVTLKR